MNPFFYFDFIEDFPDFPIPLSADESTCQLVAFTEQMGEGGMFWRKKFHPAHGKMQSTSHNFFLR